MWTGQTLPRRLGQSLAKADAIPPGARRLSPFASGRRVLIGEIDRWSSVCRWFRRWTPLQLQEAILDVLNHAGGAPGNLGKVGIRQVERHRFGRELRTLIRTWHLVATADCDRETSCGRFALEAEAPERATASRVNGAGLSIRARITPG